MTIVGMLVLGACGGVGSGSGGETQSPDPASPLSVTLVVPTTDISGGDSLPVTAQVIGSANTDVAWTVNDISNGDESTGTITGKGNSVTYVAPATEGSYDLMARSIADPVKTASVRLRVRKSDSVTVSVSPSSFSLPAGVQKQLTATVSGSGQYDPNVTWSAQLGSITSTGLYTAPATNGTDVVIAKSVQDTNKSATASVTVTTSPSATEVVGFGKNTSGGAGKTVVHVTNLNDSGPGSFRAAVGSNRIIVFDVGGTIPLTSADIVFTSVANVTIDGSTAPGPGITFTQRGINFRNSNNIIITNIRHRGGYNAGPESGGCITFHPACYNIVLDRCSFSGFQDEAIDFWNSNHDVTIQNCIVGAGQPGHNFECLVGNAPANFTIYHNLFHGGQYRNPAVGYDDANGTVSPVLCAEVINNVTWKYETHGITVYWGAKANVIGNYLYTEYYPGASNRAVNSELLGQAYASGNYSKDGSSVNGNTSTPFTVPMAARIVATTAAEAATYVKANAGCRVGGLDATDQAIINDLTY